MPSRCSTKCLTEVWVGLGVFRSCTLLINLAFMVVFPFVWVVLCPKKKTVSLVKIGIIPLIFLRLEGCIFDSSKGARCHCFLSFIAVFCCCVNFRIAEICCNHITMAPVQSLLLRQCRYKFLYYVPLLHFLYF
mgnify:CR=1 FL=1